MATYLSIQRIQKIPLTDHSETEKENDPQDIEHHFSLIIDISRNDQRNGKDSKKYIIEPYMHHTSYPEKPHSHIEQITKDQ